MMLLALGNAASTRRFNGAAITHIAHINTTGRTAAGDSTEMEIQDKNYWRNALQSALDDCGMPDALTPRQLDKAAESLAMRVRLMALRDEFAAKAMQGMLAYSSDGMHGDHHTNNSLLGVAELAYAYADAMLAARSKPHD